MKVPSITALAIAMLALCPGAAAQDERVCSQSSYLPPCPKVVWCPGSSCGVALARADGNIDIVYATDRALDGTRRRPVSNGLPLSINHLTNRVIVFEWDTDAKSADTKVPEAPDPNVRDLAVKDILYVVMPAGKN
jgi:hypothetical protein